MLTPRGAAATAPSRPNCAAVGDPSELASSSGCQEELEEGEIPADEEEEEEEEEED